MKSRTVGFYSLMLIAAALPVVGSERVKQPGAGLFVRELLLASPYRISPSARRGVIQYRLQESGDTGWEWPETGEQHVHTVPNGVLLTICLTCGKEATPAEEELSRYRRPSALVESNDRVIVSFARSAGAGSVDARMRRLVVAVQRRLSGAIVYDGYLGARAAYDAQEGDCTEYALLLAAAARARGIPARVVAGLAYGSRFAGQAHAFGPHMWVQAWNGQRWVSYDAGLGAFDAGHLALAVGDGSPDTLKGVPDVIRRLKLIEAAGLVADNVGTAETK